MAKLTDWKVKHAVAGRHSDGSNLYLVVKTTGARSWQFLFRRSGKRREMGLGGYPNVKLVEARRRALEASVMLTRGIDPLKERRAAEAADAATGITFDAFARECLAEWTTGRGWAGKTVDGWTRSLLTYSASLGPLLVRDIDTAKVLSVLTLKDFWTAHPESASKTRNRIEEVLDAAKVRGLRTGENPARWSGHLEYYLSPARKLVRGHHPAMAHVKVPMFFRKLLERPGVAARALAFSILTASRSGEVRSMTWGEVDLVSKTWTVPAERMKARREHRVPLSAEAVSLLEEAAEAFGQSGFVFPGERLGKALSDAALGKVLSLMGVAGEATPHGFRSTFKDWVRDETSHPNEVSEAALAHVVGDQTERAYARSDMFTKRRQLMTDWAQHLSMKA